jgi:hypothetical protein
MQCNMNSSYPSSRKKIDHYSGHTVIGGETYSPYALTKSIELLGVRVPAENHSIVVHTLVAVIIYNESKDTAARIIAIRATLTLSRVVRYTDRFPPRSRWSSNNSMTEVFTYLPPYLSVGASLQNINFRN